MTTNRFLSKLEQFASDGVAYYGYGVTYGTDSIMISKTSGTIEATVTLSLVGQVSGILINLNVTDLSKPESKALLCTTNAKRYVAETNTTLVDIHQTFDYLTNYIMLSVQIRSTPQALLLSMQLLTSVKTLMLNAVNSNTTVNPTDHDLFVNRVRSVAKSHKLKFVEKGDTHSVTWALPSPIASTRLVELTLSFNDNVSYEDKTPVRDFNLYAEIIDPVVDANKTEVIIARTFQVPLNNTEAFDTVMLDMYQACAKTINNTIKSSVAEGTATAAIEQMREMLGVRKESIDMVKYKGFDALTKRVKKISKANSLTVSEHCAMLAVKWTPSSPTGHIDYLIVNLVIEERVTFGPEGDVIPESKELLLCLKTATKDTGSTDLPITIINNRYVIPTEDSSEYTNNAGAVLHQIETTLIDKHAKIIKMKDLEKIVTNIEEMLQVKYVPSNVTSLNEHSVLDPSEQSSHSIEFTNEEWLTSEILGKYGIPDIAGTIIETYIGTRPKVVSSIKVHLAEVHIIADDVEYKFARSRLGIWHGNGKPFDHNLDMPEAELNMFSLLYISSVAAIKHIEENA